MPWPRSASCAGEKYTPPYVLGASPPPLIAVISWPRHRYAESASAFTVCVAGGGAQSGPNRACIVPPWSLGKSVVASRSQSFTAPGAHACGAAGAVPQLYE